MAGGGAPGNGLRAAGKVLATVGASITWFSFFFLSSSSSIWLLGILLFIIGLGIWSAGKSNATGSTASAEAAIARTLPKGEVIIYSAATRRLTPRPPAKGVLVLSSTRLMFWRRDPVKKNLYRREPLSTWEIDQLPAVGLTGTRTLTVGSVRFRMRFATDFETVLRDQFGGPAVSSPWVSSPEVPPPPPEDVPSFYAPAHTPASWDPGVAAPVARAYRNPAFPSAFQSSGAPEAPLSGDPPVPPPGGSFPRSPAESQPFSAPGTILRLSEPLGPRRTFSSLPPSRSVPSGRVSSPDPPVHPLAPRVAPTLAPARAAGSATTGESPFGEMAGNPIPEAAANAVREVLRATLRGRGEEALGNPRMIRALLSDLCPGATREITLVIAAMEEGIVDEMRGARGGSLWGSPQQIDQLARRLMNRRGLAYPSAHWAVDSWEFALS